LCAGSADRTDRDGKDAARVTRRENEQRWIPSHGLSHAHLLVRDLERSLRFYREVFGLEEQFRDGPSLVFLRTPGAQDTLTLHRADPHDPRVGATGGILHLGFRLRDKSQLDEALELALRVGGQLLSRGVHPSGTAYAYIADPDGYPLEL
jgi:catechol 2,3-dioxygenase-like lactoylglutathione lyase family enzyme